MKNGFVDVMLIIVPILIVLGVIFTILIIFNSKFRGKMMSKHVKVTKYMLDETKDDLKSITNTTADISSEAITKTTRAIKKGIKDTMFCKHCGAEIDANSKFCNNCGKEQ